MISAAINLFLPLESLHVHAAIILKFYALILKELSLFMPARGRPASMVHYSVAGVVSIKL